MDTANETIPFRNVKSKPCIECGEPTDNTCDCCARPLCEFWENWGTPCHSFHAIDSVTAGRIAHVDDVLVLDRPLYGLGDLPENYVAGMEDIMPTVHRRLA